LDSYAFAVVGGQSEPQIIAVIEVEYRAEIRIESETHLVFYLVPQCPRTHLITTLILIFKIWGNVFI